MKRIVFEVLHMEIQVPLGCAYVPIHSARISVVLQRRLRCRLLVAARNFPCHVLVDKYIRKGPCRIYLQNIFESCAAKPFVTPWTLHIMLQRHFVVYINITHAGVFFFLQRPCNCQRARKRCHCFRPHSNEIWLFSRYSTGWKWVPNTCYLFIYLSQLPYNCIITLIVILWNLYQPKSIIIIFYTLLVQSFMPLFVFSESNIQLLC